MKKPYPRPIPDALRRESSRGQGVEVRPSASVTLNCDFKKSIWPERLDVLFQLNFRR